LRRIYDAVRGCRQKHFRQTESRRNYRESHRGAADVCVPPPLSETRRVFLAPPALCTSKTNAQHRNVSSFAAVAAWRKQNEIWAPDENRSLDPLLNSLCSRQVSDVDGEYEEDTWALPS